MRSASSRPRITCSRVRYASSRVRKRSARARKKSADPGSCSPRVRSRSARLRETTRGARCACSLVRIASAAVRTASPGPRSEPAHPVHGHARACRGRRRARQPSEILAALRHGPGSVLRGRVRPRPCLSPAPPDRDCALRHRARAPRDLPRHLPHRRHALARSLAAAMSVLPATMVSHPRTETIRPRGAEAFCPGWINRGRVLARATAALLLHRGRTSPTSIPLAHRHVPPAPFRAEEFACRAAAASAPSSRSRRRARAIEPDAVSAAV